MSTVSYYLIIVGIILAVYLVCLLTYLAKRELSELKLQGRMIDVRNKLSTMKKKLDVIKKIDSQDVFVGGGSILIAVGCGMIYLPCGLIVAGLLSFLIGAGIINLS